MQSAICAKCYVCKVIYMQSAIYAKGGARELAARLLAGLRLAAFLPLAFRACRASINASIRAASSRLRG